MPTYEDPSNKMEEAFEDVRGWDCHRERLKDVKISVLSAHASRNEDDEPRGEALGTRGGKSILGKIRIMSLEDRAAGNADVRVLLNGDLWGQLSAPMQRSTIDECLTSITVQQVDGATKMDDLGRPQLRKKKWDFEICGFNEVAERNGQHSLEVHNFRVLFDKHGQTYLPHFALDDRPVDYLAVKPKQTRTRAKEIMNGGSSDSTHQRGPLASKALIAAIDVLSSPSTLLAVAKLELLEKPRNPVVKAIKSRVIEMALLMDYIRVEKGEDQQDPALDLDLDAAVLATSPDLDVDTLDRVVPGCRDVKVLGWVLEGERQREEPRQEVIDVIEARLQELGASVSRAASPKAVEPRSGDLGDKDLRVRVECLTRAESLLGIYILEMQRKKPRKLVVESLRERATELSEVALHEDMNAVDEGGHEFSVAPDLAAGVLASSSGQVTLKVLETFVPDCRDPAVLRWVLEGEQARDDARDDAVELVRGRLEQLAPAQPSATVH